MLNNDSYQGRSHGLAPTLDDGLRRLLRCARECAGRLGLRPTPVPGELARLEGSLDGTPEGAPLALHTQRYRGAGLDSLTVAALETPRGLCSLTVIGLPAAGAPLPVLGIDIIALRGTISLCALDLAPTDEAFWQERCAQVLGAVRAAAQESLVSRQRPRFADDTFSPLAIIAGVRPGREAAVLDAAALLLQRTAALLLDGPGPVRAPAQLAASRQRLQRWLAAERQNRKEHNALARMFGPEAAARYLDKFLFAPNQADG